MIIIQLLILKTLVDGIFFNIFDEILIKFLTIKRLVDIAYIPLFQFNEGEL
jgi:hypothetical protein